MSDAKIGAASASSGVALSSPSINSKLIVENMASVISSVKKHQRRTKRKRRDAAANADEPEICDISAILTNSLRFVSPNVSGSAGQADGSCAIADSVVDAAENGGIAAVAVVVGGVGDDDDDDDGGTTRPTATTPSKKPTKSRSRSKTTRRSHKENTNSSNRTPSKSPPSPSTNPACSPLTTSASTTCPTAAAASGAASTTTTTPKKNAFELLMNARNKSIGTNSPAKDTMTSSRPDTPGSATKTKRKLMLEAWADRKGASKRRLQDDEAEEYVNRAMQKRAKRLKRLLANGQRAADDVSCDEGGGLEDVEPIEVGESCDDAGDVLVDVDQTAVDLNGSYVKFNFKRFNKMKETKKPRKIKSTVFGSDDDNEATEVQPAPPPPLQIEVKPVDVVVVVVATAEQKSPIAASAPPSILTALRSPPPSKSPHKPAPVRRKSIYVQKTPTKCRPKNAPDVIDMCLSSPIKKRDSLLGYFNKVDKSPSSDDALVDTVVVSTAEPDIVSVPAVQLPTTKRRGRPPKSTAARAQPPDNVRECTPPRSFNLTYAAGCELSAAETDVDTPGSGIRPRRGCREKTISYRPPATEINERSPAKMAAQKSVRRARRLLSGGSPQKCASPGRSPRGNGAGRKLAPIFVKAPVRPPLDPETARARQEFLRSGIPEKMRLDIEKQKVFAESYACELDVFPLVSHVTQLPTKVEDVRRTPPNIRYRVDADEDDVSAIKYTKFQLGNAKNRVQPETPVRATSPKTFNALNLTKPKDLVKQLKELDFGKFLYFRGYKQLRRMYEEHLETAPDRSASLNTSHEDTSNDSVEIIEPTATNQQPNATNGTLMFTEKYKPACSDEIIVNSVPVFQLKRFLATWQENYAQRSSHRRTSSNDTDDDFETGSNSASSSLSKVICLVGPTGVGKTNAVYALANEMNFNVLEINAGCKRTGKKMLQELHEATQSHQVKSGGGGVLNGDRLFRSSQQAHSSEESSSVGAAPASPKLSLILIEDADIVFEQDNGFVDAIFQLVATSKRPVILAANRRSCPHLARLIGANAIDFEPANATHAGKWLSLLSIAEHRYVGHVDCTRLYRHNGQNMRRTVLELQFFLQSGGDRDRHADGMCGKHYAHQRLYEVFARPGGSQGGVLPQPVDFDGVHDKTEVILRTDGGRSLSDVLAYYQTMSAAQRMQSVGQRQRIRCAGDDGLTWNMAEELTWTLAEAAIVAASSAAKLSLDPPSSRAEESNLISRSSLLSAGLATASFSRRAVHLDVEPCLRAICRSEKTRTLTERTNRRFYHYLRNVVQSGSCSFSSADTFDRHCDTLSDDPAPTSVNEAPAAKSESDA